MPDVAAYFVDVGGTLWPDHPPSPGNDVEGAATRLARQFPALHTAEAAALADGLRTAVPHAVDGDEQRTDEAVRAVVERLGIVAAVDHDFVAVQRAFCAPALGRWTLYEGARELLTVMHSQAPVVLVSNAVWRDAYCYCIDLATLGVGELVDDVVSSVDVGFRKPHPAMLDTALRVAGNPDPRRCVMVGDREAADIVPAADRGMYTVCVAIDTTPPTTTRADVVVRSLGELERMLDAHHADQRLG